MKYFEVIDWDKLQHYSDRKNPPWTKFHFKTFSSYRFQELTEVQRFHLIGIWSLSSQHGNRLPYDSDWIGRKIDATTEIDFAVLEHWGYIRPLTAEEAAKPYKVFPKKDNIPYKRIIDYLNEKVNASYRVTTRKTRSLIRARWNEGFRVEDFKKVVDNMSWRWSNKPDMCIYLRPSTLFNAKFEEYLQTTRPKPRKLRDDFEDTGEVEEDLDDAAKESIAKLKGRLGI